MDSIDFAFLTTDTQPIARFIEEEGKKLAKERGINFRLNQGYRSPMEQHRLFKQGRTTPGNIVTNADAWYSWHNWGRAVDGVFLSRDLKKALYTADLYIALVERVLAAGIVGLYAGKSFGDLPHFEYHPGWGPSIPTSMITRYKADYRTLPTSNPNPTGMTFTDVPDGSPNQGEIEQMYSLGIMVGILKPDGTRVFQPDRAVTRRELAVILSRLNVGAAKSGWIGTTGQAPTPDEKPSDDGHVVAD